MQKGLAKTLANPLQERKRQDSNLRTALGRSTVFEAASFSHSDTLPVIYIGTLSQTLTLRAAFASSTYLLPQIPGPGRSSDDDLLNSPDPLFKGAIRAYGLSIAAGPSLLASSGPASDDALLFYWDSVPNPDTPCGLCVLHVFAVANTRTRPVV